jgi:hypothetical protein
MRRWHPRPPLEGTDASTYPSQPAPEEGQAQRRDVQRTSPPALRNVNARVNRAISPNRRYPPRNEKGGRVRLQAAKPSGPLAAGEYRPGAAFSAALASAAPDRRRKQGCRNLTAPLLLRIVPGGERLEIRHEAEAFACVGGDGCLGGHHIDEGRRVR